MQDLNFEPYFHLNAQNGEVLLPANFAFPPCTPNPSDFVLCLQITVIEFVNKGQNWKDREVVHIWYTFQELQSPTVKFFWVHPHERLNSRVWI